MKSVSFRTVGCRLNQAETALFAAQFLAAGYQIVPFDRSSDVAVIHSCAVTHRAERDTLRLVRSLKRRTPSPTVILAGCAAEIDPDRMRCESQADIVVGQSDKFRMPELVAAKHCIAPPVSGRPDALRSLPTTSDSVGPLTPHFETTRALVRVQNGCDFGCAYCVVPLARGAPASRPSPEILQEITRLAAVGYREIVLTGANLGCFSDGSHRLVDLLQSVEEIHGIERIRLSSIEVSTVERAILDYMASSRKLCPYLHLPMQSGDDNLLAAMGRRYTRAQYVDIVQCAVSKIPNIGLGTDILVGFPGETPSAFENTRALVLDLPFSNLHVFPYSSRPMTRAACLPDSVEPREKRRRARAIMDIGTRKRQEYALRFIGKKVSVLIEEVLAADRGRGWTGEYVQAEVSSSGDAVNSIVEFIPSSFRDGRLM